MNILFVFEIIGTIAFAVSGAGVAIEKKMDIFGVAILGTTTAIGGGIIRDIILAVTPPVAFQKPIYAIVAIFISLLVFVPKIRRYALNHDNKFLLIMDSLGLAAFTVVGVRAGMGQNSMFLAVFVGVLTGVGGGVLRDLFAGNSPYIFNKHFYACASIVGAIITAVTWPVGEIPAMLFGAVPIFILRLLAAKYKWNLPRA